MFSNCRVCANTPFGTFFGYDTDRGVSSDRRHHDRRRREVSTMLSQATSAESESGIQRATSEERMRFRPRSPEEVMIKTKAWEAYIHARAHRYWDDPNAIHEILMKIAQSIDKESDPIIGEGSRCVFWHGDFNDQDNLPILRMIKPEQSEETEGYVTRLIVFLYADDESFAALQHKEQTAFDMVCQEPTCINLSHIGLD